MNFVEYIKKMQKKYRVSNGEILEELQKNNIPADKSSISRKLNGERPISEDEFSAILNVLNLPTAELSELRQLYKIYCIGEERYKDIQCMKMFVERFNEETIPYIPDRKLNPAQVKAISDHHTLGSLLFSVLETAWGISKIQIICQPEYRALADICIRHTLAHGTTEIEQIVCFNNSENCENNTYNIRGIKTLCDVVMYNNQHRIRYYYDDVQAHINAFSLYPFMVIAGEYVVLISENFEAGYCFHDMNFVKSASERFETMFESAQPLFEEIHDDLEYLKISMELEQNTFKEFYTLQFHPCVLFEGSLEYAQRKIKESFPYKDEMVRLYVERISQFNNCTSYHIYSQDGMKDFLATGRTLDLSEELFYPLDEEERKSIAAHFKVSAPNQSGYAVPSSELKIPSALTIACYDNGNVIIGFKNPDFAGYRWIMKERSIWKSMMTFLKFLREEIEENT